MKSAKNNDTISFMRYKQSMLLKVAACSLILCFLINSTVYGFDSDTFDRIRARESGLKDAVEKKLRDNEALILKFPKPPITPHPKYTHTDRAAIDPEEDGPILLGSGIKKDAEAMGFAKALASVINEIDPQAPSPEILSQGEVSAMLRYSRRVEDSDIFEESVQRLLTLAMQGDLFKFSVQLDRVNQGLARRGYAVICDLAVDPFEPFMAAPVDALMPQKHPAKRFDTLSVGREVGLELPDIGGRANLFSTRVHSVMAYEYAEYVYGYLTNAPDNEEAENPVLAFFHAQWNSLIETHGREEVVQHIAWDIYECLVREETLHQFHILEDFDFGSHFESERVTKTGVVATSRAPLFMLGYFLNQTRGIADQVRRGNFNIDPEDLAGFFVLSEIGSRLGIDVWRDFAAYPQQYSYQQMLIELAEFNFFEDEIVEAVRGIMAQGKDSIRAAASDIYTEETGLSPTRHSMSHISAEIDMLKQKGGAFSPNGLITAGHKTDKQGIDPQEKIDFFRLPFHARPFTLVSSIKTFQERARALVRVHPQERKTISTNDLPIPRIIMVPMSGGVIETAERREYLCTPTKGCVVLTLYNKKKKTGCMLHLTTLTQVELSILIALQRLGQGYSLSPFELEAKVSGGTDDIGSRLVIAEALDVLEGYNVEVVEQNILHDGPLDVAFELETGDLFEVDDGVGQADTDAGTDKQSIDPKDDTVVIDENAIPVLSVNCGSSSVKYKFYDMQNESVIGGGLGEGTIEIGTGPGQFIDHETAIRHILEILPCKPIKIGHRVVHGGEFRESTLITDDVIKKIREYFPLAPLHNPPNLKGILICQELLPDVPQVAVFDTAFHATIPKEAYTYPIPKDIAEKFGIRRYGFHGTSHRYVAKESGKKNLITCHLGNGCSMAAIKDGKSIDTTMGFTPLEGLVMGTRTGTFPADILIYIMRKIAPSRLTIWKIFWYAITYFPKKIIGKNPGTVIDALLNEMDKMLNKKSGLLGVSGLSNDMRTLLQARAEGNEDARLAIELFTRTVARHIAMYYAELNGEVDSIIFTGGIGENAQQIREEIIYKLPPAIRDKIPMEVISTNEELMIARDTMELTGLKEATDRQGIDPGEYITRGPDYTLVERETHRKAHFSAVARRGLTVREQFGDIIRYVEKILQRNGGDLTNIVRGTVFLERIRDKDICEKILREHFGDLPPPVDFLEQPPLEPGKKVAFEVWADIPKEPGSINITRITEHTTIVEEDGVYQIHVGGVTSDEDKRTTYYDESKSALVNLQEELRRASEHLGINVSIENTVRAWFYNPEFLQDGQDPNFPNDPTKLMERYKIFCAARTDIYDPIEFISEILDPGFVEANPGFFDKTKAYPASTGIGTKIATPLTLGLVVVAAKDDRKDRVRSAPISNPRQTNPADYSDKYGKKSPKFSRAGIVEFGDEGALYISGTASILKEGTVDLDDVAGQTHTTLDNIEALISRENLTNLGMDGWGANLEDIAQLRVYIRDPKDYKTVRRICEERVPGIPIIYVEADVCRKGLLVEIEGLVYLKRSTGADTDRQGIDPQQGGNDEIDEIIRSYLRPSGPIVVEINDMEIWRSLMAELGYKGAYLMGVTADLAFAQARQWQKITGSPPSPAFLDSVRDIAEGIPPQHRWKVFFYEPFDNGYYKYHESIHYNMSVRAAMAGHYLVDRAGQDTLLDSGTESASVRQLRALAANNSQTRGALEDLLAALRRYLPSDRSQEVFAWIFSIGEYPHFIGTPSVRTGSEEAEYLEGYLRQSGATTTVVLDPTRRFRDTLNRDPGANREVITFLHEYYRKLRIFSRSNQRFPTLPASDWIEGLNDTLRTSTAESDQLVDGVNARLPGAVAYKGRADYVVTIADFVHTLAPGLVPLEGVYLEAFVENLKAGDLTVVTTGDNSKTLWRCLAEPLLARLHGDERELLKKLVVIYNTSNGAFGLTPTGDKIDYWLPDIVSHEERKRSAIGLITAFWDEIENRAVELDLSVEVIRRHKERSLTDFNESASMSAGWRDATPQSPYSYHLMPDSLGLGDISMSDSGCMITLCGFKDVSGRLKGAFNGNMSSATRIIAAAVSQAVLPLAEKIKYVMAGPNYIDMTQGQKKEGVLDILAQLNIKRLAGGKKVAIFLLGDSINDSHLDISAQRFNDELGIDSVAIPVFVGSDESVVSQITSEPMIITIPKEADGGALVLRAAARAKGRDLEDVIVRTSTAESNPIESKTEAAKIHFMSIHKDMQNDPLATGILALISAMKAKGLEEFTFTRVTKENFVVKTAEAKDTGANVIGIPVTAHTQHYVAVMVENIRRHSPDSFVLIGGPWATEQPRDIVEHINPDIILRGEAEEALPQLLRAIGTLKRGDPIPESVRERLREIRGLFFRAPDGSFTIDNRLDEYDQISDLEIYPIDIDAIEILGAGEYIPISTMRGCPRRCRFCLRVHGENVRAMRPEAVVDMIERIAERYPGRKIYIADDNFLLSGHYGDGTSFAGRGRALEFCRLYKERGLDIKIGKLTSLQTSILSFWHKGQPDTDLIRELASIFDRVNIGTDGFCQRELERQGKGYNWDIVEPIVKALEEAKFDNLHFVILVNIDTQDRDLRESLTNIIALDRKYKRFNILLNERTANIMRPYKGTLAYEDLERRELLSRLVWHVPILDRPQHKTLFGILPLDSAVKNAIYGDVVEETPDGAMISLRGIQSVRSNLADPELLLAKIDKSGHESGATTDRQGIDPEGEGYGDRFSLLDSAITNLDRGDEIIMDRSIALGGLKWPHANAAANAGAKLCSIASLIRGVISDLERNPEELEDPAWKIEERALPHLDSVVDFITNRDIIEDLGHETYRALNGDEGCLRKATEDLQEFVALLKGPQDGDDTDRQGIDPEGEEKYPFAIPVSRDQDFYYDPDDPNTNINHFSIGRSSQVLDNSGAQQCIYLLAYDASAKVGSLGHIDLTWLADIALGDASHREKRRAIKDGARGLHLDELTYRLDSVLLNDQTVIDTTASYFAVALDDMVGKLVDKGATQENLQFIVLRNTFSQDEKDDAKYIELMSVFNTKVTEVALLVNGFSLTSIAMTEGRGEEIRFELKKGIVTGKDDVEVLRFDTPEETDTDRQGIDPEGSLHGQPEQGYELNTSFVMHNRPSKTMYTVAGWLLKNHGIEIEVEFVFPQSQADAPIRWLVTHDDPMENSILFRLSQQKLFREIGISGSPDYHIVYDTEDGFINMRLFLRGGNPDARSAIAQILAELLTNEFTDLSGEHIDISFFGERYAKVALSGKDYQRIFQRLDSAIEERGASRIEPGTDRQGIDPEGLGNVWDGSRIKWGGNYAPNVRQDVEEMIKDAEITDMLSRMDPNETLHFIQYDGDGVMSTPVTKQIRRVLRNMVRKFDPGFIIFIPRAWFAKAEDHRLNSLRHEAGHIALNKSGMLDKKMRRKTAKRFESMPPGAVWFKNIYEAISDYYVVRFQMLEGWSRSAEGYLSIVRSETPDFYDTEALDRAQSYIRHYLASYLAFEIEYPGLRARLREEIRRNFRLTSDEQRTIHRVMNLTITPFIEDGSWQDCMALSRGCLACINELEQCLGPEAASNDGATDRQGIDPQDATIPVTSQEARETLTQDAMTLFNMNTQGLTEEFIEGRIYDLTVSNNWKAQHPEQYQMIEEWWETLRKLFPKSTFNNIRLNGKGGLVKITSSILPEYDTEEGVRANGKIKIGSSSIELTGSNDIGYRIFKVLNIAFAASNIPDDINSWNDNARALVEFINSQYRSLTGSQEPYIDIEETLELIIDRKQRIKIYLPPIQRQDFNLREELLMAQEALKAV